MKIQKLKEIFLYKVILSFLDTVISLYTATKMSNIINVALDDAASDLFSSILFFMFFSLSLIVFRGVLSHFFAKRKVLVQQNLKIGLYRDFFSLSPSDIYRNRDAGDVLESFRNDFDTVVNLQCNVIPSMIVSGLSYVLYLTYAGTTDWVVAVIMLLLSQLQLVVPLLISPKFYDNYEEGREWEAKATNVEIEAHTAFKDIKIFHLQEWYSRYLETYQNGSSKIAKKQEYLIGIGTSLETMVASVIKYGTYILIGIFTFQERIYPDDAVLLMFLSSNIYTSLLGVYEQIVHISENRMAKERLKQVSESRNGDSPASLHNKKEILFEDCIVTVNEQTILDLGTISVVSDIPNVIMGENGSGKSTLLKVLAGFIRPAQCQVLSTTEDNDSDIFYLPQEDLWLQESALELIDISEHSAYIWFCKKWFDITEEKLNQPIRTLSGGERKKVFLALSFIKRGNSFLLLDEPTNHLDSPAKLCLAQIISERPEKLVIVSHDIEFLEALKTQTDISITRVMKGE